MLFISTKESPDDAIFVAIFSEMTLIETRVIKVSKFKFLSHTKKLDKKSYSSKSVYVLRE